jgi:transposase
MIDPEKRNAIYQSHLGGMRLREISRRFQVSRNTVRMIIRQQGAMPQTVRKDKIPIAPELLRRLYHQCDGWMQRIHQKLVEEEGIQVSYPTLTRLLRELDLSKSRKGRCDKVPDQRGAEMQHDITVYQVKLAGRSIRVIASSLSLRYCKRRYLKFYRVFNRSAMECFLHEALMFWGDTAKQCIVDNTSLAGLRGSGTRAVGQAAERAGHPARTIS